MKNYKLVVVPLLLVICCAAACKKKKNDNPFGSARLATISQTHTGSIMNYRIVYDASGNVDSIIVNGDGLSIGYSGYKKFNYFGSSFSVTDDVGNTFTVLANTSGLILKVLIPDTVSMIYNGNEIGSVDVRTAQTAYPYYSITRTNYTWKNGDITADSTGGPAYHFSYDAGRNGQPGDAWRIGEFLIYGRSFIKTTQLPIEMNLGSTWVQKYLYEFDGSGRISRFTRIANNNGVGADDTTFYSYSYY